MHVNILVLILLVSWTAYVRALKNVELLTMGLPNLSSKWKVIESRNLANSKIIITTTSTTVLLLRHKEIKRLRLLKIVRIQRHRLTQSKLKPLKSIRKNNL